MSSKNLTGLRNTTPTFHPGPKNLPEPVKPNSKRKKCDDLIDTKFMPNMQHMREYNDLNR